MNNTKASKKWFMATILVTTLFLIFIALVTIVVDPLFHYHAPLEGLQYNITDERYSNDGISRHFDYDAIITGSSTTENFLPSECDKLFGANTIKISLSGSYWGEISREIQQSFEYNDQIKMVIRGMDLGSIYNEWDAEHEYGIPLWLRNSLWFDDVNYVFNKTLFINRTLDTLLYTLSGGNTTSRDEYSYWSTDRKYGYETVLTHSSYIISDENAQETEMSKDQRRMVLDNVQKNITDLADAHPNTQFYLYLTPYNIAYWDVNKCRGTLQLEIETQRIVIEELLSHSNIKLYSFYTNYDMICNLDNYTDLVHYGDWINSDMLQWMANDEYLLTEDNYNEYMDEIENFYSSYDYTYLHELKKSYE